MIQSCHKLRTLLLPYLMSMIFAFSLLGLNSEFHAAESDSNPSPLKTGTLRCMQAIKGITTASAAWLKRRLGALNPSDDVTTLLQFPTAKERLTQLYRAIHRNKPGRFMGTDHRMILRWIETSTIISDYLAPAAIHEFVRKQQESNGTTDLISYTRYIIEELTTNTIALEGGERSLARAHLQTVRRFGGSLSKSFLTFLLGALAVVAADYVRGPLAPLNDKYMGPWYSFWYATYNGAGDLSSRALAKTDQVKKSLQELAKDSSLIPPQEFEQKFHLLIAEWAGIYSNFKASFGGAVATGQAMDNDYRTLVMVTLNMAKTLEIQIRNIEVELASPSLSLTQKTMLEELKKRWEADLAEVLIQLEFQHALYAFNLGHNQDVMNFIRKFGFDEWVRMAGGKDRLVEMLRNLVQNPPKTSVPPKKP